MFFPRLALLAGAAVFMFEMVIAAPLPTARTSVDAWAGYELLEGRNYGEAYRLYGEAYRLKFNAHYFNADAAAEWQAVKDQMPLYEPAEVKRKIKYYGKRAKTHGEHVDLLREVRQAITAKDKERMEAAKAKTPLKLAKMWKYWAKASTKKAQESSGEAIQLRFDHYFKTKSGQPAPAPHS